MQWAQELRNPYSILPTPYSLLFLTTELNRVKKRVEQSSASKPYTLHSTLYTLLPTPYSLLPTPYSLNQLLKILLIIEQVAGDAEVIASV